MGKKTKLFIDIDNFYIRQGGPSKRLLSNKLSFLRNTFKTNINKSLIINK